MTNPQTNPHVVNIHGKEYMTVAGRLELAHASCDFLSITTELVKDDPVTIKATITLRRKNKKSKEIYSDYSAANPTKLIEKQSPIEVASTSAVGRALGYAGFGLVESVASADEMIKAVTPQTPSPTLQKPTPNPTLSIKCTQVDCKSPDAIVATEVIKYSTSRWGRVICYRCQQTLL